MLVNEEEVVNKLAIYLFLQKFYAGQLNQMDQTSWEKLIGLINQEMTFFSHEGMKKGLETLSKIPKDDISELEFEFNRLFVGPNRLEVSPYASTYRNDQRALMQGETLAVRKFYEKAGLVVSKKNVDPDDHLALELEFVCYLLGKSLEDEMYYHMYHEFLKEHLFHWIESHCELIREKTKNTILIGISYILQGLLLEEKSNVSIEGGK